MQVAYDDSFEEVGHGGIGVAHKRIRTHCPVSLQLLKESDWDVTALADKMRPLEIAGTQCIIQVHV